MHILFVLCFNLILSSERVRTNSETETKNQETLNLTQELVKLHKENVDLRRRLETLESKSENTDGHVRKLHRENNELRQRLEHIEHRNMSDDRNIVPRGIVDETPALAFFAKLSSHVGDISNGMTIKFDNIETNFGGGYNGITGIFTCNTQGLYYFSINVMTHPGKYVELAVVVNGVAKINVLADASNSSEYDEGSNSGIVRLQSGDSVWIKVSYHIQGTTGNVLYYKWTTFSGFLISQI